MMNRLLRLSGETGVILLAFLLWWRLSDRSESLFFPPLRDMLTDAWSYWTSPAGWADMASTLGNIIAGFIDGLAAGIAGALLLGRLRALMVMLVPLIELLRATPNVILLPITISMLGIGNEMKQLNIAIAVYCPVFITTLDGYRHIPSPLRETARAFLLRPWTQFLYVTLPALLPALLPAMLTGIHIAIPLSLITSITSEMVGETRGIGSVILSAQYRFDITRMWSGVLLLALLGFSVNKVFSVMKTAIIRRLH